ncbi:MAG: signal peptidase I [Candidatus Aenigmatarchaeota archaeon]
MAGRKQKNSLLRDIAETAAYAVVGVIIAMVIYQALIIALGTKRPVIDVVSESMVPAINKGDLVIVKYVQPSTLKIGDIIVFETLSEPLPVIHRLYKINADGTFQTLGDNNHGEQHDWEKNIQGSAIVGKAIFVIPYVGWVKIITCDALPNVCTVFSPAVRGIAG